METVTTTIYGSYIQTCQLLNKQPNILQYTTLNEKFNIYKDEVLYDGEIPRLAYVAIGNGGHKLSTGANGIGFNTPVLHTPRHASLYSHMPFVLRTVDNDLTAIERDRFRLRKVIDINGVTYVAYYLRVLDLAPISPAMEHKLVENNTIYTNDFIPAASDLEPTPPNLDPNATNTTTGEYLASTAKIPFVMDSNDIIELQNACRILYGSDEYAIISEVALCTGIERALDGDFNGTIASYNEAIAVQVSGFINTLYSTKYINDKIDVVFDVGAVEPLQVVG